MGTTARAWREVGVRHGCDASAALAAGHGLGRSWGLYGVVHHAAAFRFLPEATRLQVVKRVLGPFGSWWLKPRLEGVVPLHVGQHITEATRNDDGVTLTTRDTDGRTRTIETGHVLAATGYRIRLDAVDFLAPRTAGRADPHGRLPAPRRRAAVVGAGPVLHRHPGGGDLRARAAVHVRHGVRGTATGCGDGDDRLMADRAWGRRCGRTPPGRRPDLWPSRSYVGPESGSAGPDRRGRDLRRGVAQAEAKVLDVVEGLFQEFGDVVVVERVDDRAAAALSGDQTEVAQQT
ncbi:hypothetical protein M2283_009356 [Streptomyces pseudovenezuelae]|uniref:FAD/NAD(P)-binding domain-containing protein n=1 Tax=Streptomyces pseudovenezuelae TaxID=67350 RepID=A0ABT6M0C0_9ACTN|nr:hypothetical protein [Streptomyces pseudovenezuelae]